MNRTHTLLFLILLFPLLHSCATAPKTLMREDPLIGKIVEAGTQRFIDFNSLVDRLADQDVIYLSEKHDNPMHHAVQHRIIQELINRGKSPVIGFEFFSMEDTPHLLNFLDSGQAAHSKKQEAVIEKDLRIKLGWENQSDRMWKFYFDLVSLGRDNGLTMAGLDLSQVLKRRITRKGISGLTRIEKEQIFSTEYGNKDYQDHMETLFKEVHCGMGHGKMTKKLYDTWLARNDKMALSITQLVGQASGRGPVVVIMGNGHTEYGLGVVDRVKFLAPGITQKNLSMVEITREPSGLEEYFFPLDLQGFAPAPPADFLWFTQRVSYKDPCEKFRKIFKKMKSRKEMNPGGKSESETEDSPGTSTT
ncbi:ChaN family lipoprotein [Desulfospira joergensenii]|uniref:ChaN family lipoprotein n=1 Tax=Desulfospira joergensenii TaxID=53329 RepID=UPI000419A37C|nr:ChaN family lipoprotein [Desulfospira joergensenii]